MIVRQGAGFAYVYFHTWTFSDAQVIPQGTDGVVDFVLGSCFPEADVIIPFSDTFTCGSSFTDGRDGKTYTSVQIGTQCWMKENLNVGTRINGSSNQTNNGVVEKYCFNNLESNCDVYGGLYQWNELMQYVSTQGVKGICPLDWHIPTDQELSLIHI